MELPTLFEWDDTKAGANEVKHGVPFDYVTRTFLDPDCLIISARRTNASEERRYHGYR